ncbi:MAG TPA: sulfatase [Pirellulaceae bacterium]|nr:sulfatase [Pirellulaceae bacterium]
MSTRCLAIVLILAAAWFATAADLPPNFVVVYCDDLGYADVGCFGAKGYTTPHIDQLAREGMRLTDFHTAAAVCSASRVALLTGCYPQRVGILGALGPKAKIGIHEDEVLLPEILKERGYATAIFGKWHLGDDPKFLPTRHGFDRYFGLPYSNDMWPNHPTNKTFPPLPLIEGEEIVELMPDQTQLTTWYTERAVKFIADSKDKPFFLYVPHSMPHVPLFVSDKFKDKSGAGLYGDVIQEIDWSVGQIMAALKQHGLDGRTLVIFTSDNGPWLSYGNHAGSAGPLREGKGTTWQGGQQVPCIARWPGKIEAGSECPDLTATIDVLPTLAKLAGGKAPEDRVIDGRDIWPLLSGRSEKGSPERSFYYYWDFGLDAVRMGPWKLVFPHKFRSLTGTPGKDGQPGGYSQAETGMALYNLDTDVGETKDVAADHPQIVADLKRLAEQAREDLGDSHQMRPGKNRRPPGRLAANAP